MPFISDNIPNLIQGISQQPPRLRTITQLAEQENCYSSVVEGLTQRPPTEYIAKVSTTALDQAKIHTINRDVDNRFKAVLSNGLVQVFDLAGTAKTVNVADDTTQIFSAAAVSTGATFEMATAPSETTIDFTTSGFGTATIVLEGSVNGTTGWTVMDTRTTNGTTAGITISPYKFMRGRISAWTSGTIVGTVTYKNMRYLLSAFPKYELKALTIADFTFLLNTLTIPAMDSALSPVRTEEGLVFVRAGEYGSTYEVKIDGTVRATYITSTTDVLTLSTTNIATELYNDLVAWGGAGFTFTRSGSTIWIQKTGAAYTLASTDSQGGNSLFTFKETTPRFSDLPVEAPNGFVIAIDADTSSDKGKYYVRFDTVQALAFGPGTWAESLAPGIVYSFNDKTMPYQLVHEVNDTFTYGPVAWEDRLVGDDDSNPAPSFIGVAINAMSFYKNRLVFFADENFVGSVTGEYFNYWRTSVTQIIDADIVDSRATDLKVSILRQAVLFNKSLLCFSDQAQFEIPSDTAFTAKTVRCDLVSNFESLTDVQPINAGKLVQFAFDRATYTGLKELFVSSSNALTMEAEDVSAHVPSYVPTGAFNLSVSTLEGVSVLTTDGDPDSVYVYKTEWKGEKKVQSAWFRWNFNDNTASTTIVLSADFIGSTLYLLIQRNNEVFLERMQLLTGRVDDYSVYLTILDRRIDDTQTVSRVYNSGTKQTTITLPYTILSTETVVVTRSVADNSPWEDVGRYVPIVSNTVGGTTIVVTGDFSANPLWIGQRVIASATLSEIFKRNRTTGAIDPTGKLTLTRGFVTYARTGAFQVRVTPLARDTSTYQFTGRIVGDVNNEIGAIALSDGSFSFGILAKSKQVTIQLYSDSFLPFRLTSLEWEGTYTKRSLGAQGT